MKNNFATKDIIPKYGKLLRGVSQKSIAELDDAFGKNCNFQLQQINDMINEFKGVMPPNRVSHYILAFINSGNGIKTIGNYSFNIQPNMVMMFPKNIIHSSREWSLNTFGYMLSFNESLFNEAQFPLSFLQLQQLFKLSSQPYRICDTSESKKIEELYSQIMEYQNFNDLVTQKMFIVKLTELILLYQKIFSLTDSCISKTDRVFDEFVELVENNFREKKEVKQYADMLNIHPSHLNRVVMSCASVSAKDYILKRILTESKYILYATNISVKEIAYDLGYTDSNYFCRQFKNLQGETPIEFRNKSRHCAI